MPMVSIAWPHEARSKQSFSTRVNFFSLLSGIQWSAGRIAIVAVVARAPAMAVANATAGHVLRPHGSTITFSFGSLGSCFLTAAAWGSLVITNTFFGRTTPLIRSTVSCRSDFLLNKASSCLGVASRLNGQNRSPRPPAQTLHTTLPLTAPHLLLHCCSPPRRRPTRRRRRRRRRRPSRHQRAP